MFNYSLFKVNPVIKNAVKIKRLQWQFRCKTAFKEQFLPSKVKSANYFRKAFKILTGCCAFLFVPSKFDGGNLYLLRQ
jgi:hypothetical protein